MSTDKRKIFWLIIIRLVVITSLLITAIILQSSTPAVFLPLEAFVYVISFTYLLSLVFILLYFISSNHTAQAYLQILLDLFLITGLVYISGGLTGSFYFLYLFSIIAASIVISGRSAYLMAALSAVLFGLMVDGLYFHVIPYFSPEFEEPQSFEVVLFTIIMAWLVFFVMAFLSSNLAGNLTKTRDKLRLAQKELEIKERLAAAGTISAQLAHEIRNPLAAISGAVQVMKDIPSLNDDQKKLMAIVLKESQRVSQSIEQFLGLASPGRQVFSGFNMAEAFREVVAMFRASGEIPDAVRVEGNFTNADIRFFGSANQFKQIFWNLLRNAVRAMPEGGVLTVDFNEDLKKKETGFRMADTGCGLSHEEREHIFEPFYSGFEGGTGIGMTVVRRIVDDYEGRIQVLSQKGKGTEFILTFPVRRRMETA